jgi:hypothetical protein
MLDLIRRTTVRSPATAIGRRLKQLGVRTNPRTRLGDPMGQILVSGGEKIN